MAYVGRKEWDLNILFKSDDDSSIEKERKIIKNKADEFVTKWKSREDYLEDPEILKEALDEYEELIRNYGTSGNAGYYFHLRRYIDQMSSELKAKGQKVDEAAKEIQNSLQFFILRLAKIPESEQKKFLEEERLKNYRHFLEKVFREAKHHLSEAEEKIVNLLSTNSYDKWVDMLSSFLSKEEPEVKVGEKREKKSFEELQGLMEDQNKEIRDSAAKAFNEILSKHQDTAEAEINAILSYKKIMDDMRKLARPDSSRHLDDDIESEVVDEVVRQVAKNFNIARRFYMLKAQLLGVSKIKYYERNVSYGSINKEYSYEDAVAIVRKVLNNLDREFSSIFDKFRKEGSIDVFPKKGKKSGAWCIHNLIGQPTYILLNYTGRLNDVRTLAHEVGHGINNELMRKVRNSLDFGTPKSTAEVASTFIEDFVLDELMKEADDELKLSIYMFKLNQDISTIFRQISFYRFEQELHALFREKGYLSKEEIGSIFVKNLKEYMGETIDFTEGSENWWLYVPHFRDFFYVYSYASGLLISKSLQNKVRKDPQFIEKVKEFLSAGLSDSPKNIFAKLGIDIMSNNFWEVGLKEVESLLKETESLARKLGKIK
ncbi:MAG: M3 family oligoendopeptidase [Nanoarchaeota archaeon]|nr:M3 family oligoendopeptidase [Nanoarchaeota archaeon]